MLIIRIMLFFFAYIALICLFICYMIYIHNIIFICISYADLTLCYVLLLLYNWFLVHLTFFFNCFAFCFCWIYVINTLTHHCHYRWQTDNDVVFYIVSSIAWLSCCCCGAWFMLLAANFSLLYSRGPTMCLSCVVCSCCVGCLCVGCQRVVVMYPTTNIFLTFIASAEDAFRLLFIVALN